MDAVSGYGKAVIEEKHSSGDFDFVDNVLTRKAYAVAMNGRVALKDCGDDWEKMYAVESSIRDKFIELGVPRSLYDQLVFWDRTFRETLGSVEAKNPGTVGPTTRVD